MSLSLSPEEQEAAQTAKDWLNPSPGIGDIQFRPYSAMTDLALGQVFLSAKTAGITISSGLTAWIFAYLHTQPREQVCKELFAPAADFLGKVMTWASSLPPEMHEAIVDRANEELGRARSTRVELAPGPEGTPPGPK